MTPIKVLASALHCIFISICWLTVSVLSFGDGMGSSRTSHSGYSLLEVLFKAWLVALSILPIVCLWMQSRILIYVSAIIMLPLVIVGLYTLKTPLAGIPILITLFVWYYAAYHQKERLKQD